MLNSRRLAGNSLLSLARAMSWMAVIILARLISIP